MADNPACGAQTASGYEMKLTDFTTLTFDCYGTLIDWESGILRALRALLKRHGKSIDDARLLEMYATLESRAEAGPYRPYKDVLASVVTELGRGLGFDPEVRERGCLAESLPIWPPFPDTVEALRRLEKRFRLGIISNVDDDLFAATAASLGVTFDWVVTAQQARAYKPSASVFEHALERIGLPRDRILHVAQSLHHDIAPASALGLATVWINRRENKPGHGATPPARARADRELPDLAALAALAAPGA